MMILMRGIPGSGKSTLARKYCEQLKADGYSAVVYSSDDLFMVDGEYRFDATKLHQNHKRNQDKVRTALRAGKDVVFVDNTNTTYKECKTYVEIAREQCVPITLLTPDTLWGMSPELCADTTLHGVPIESIQKMYDRFESNEVVVEKICQNFDFYTPLRNLFWMKTT